MTILDNISIILSKPQMGENIGAVARAMKNFCLTDLRIINPRDGWPNPKANDMSAGGLDIIENAKIYDNFEAAISDLNFIYATTARERDLSKKAVSTKDMSGEIINKISNSKIGILFGCEKSGLDNQEISFCNEILYIQANNEYSSLNIAQSVNVLAYEIYTKFLEVNNIENSISKPPKLAEKKELNSLYNYLENKLEEANFFQVAEKKPKMMNNIRSMFSRINFTEQELKTFRGILKAIEGSKS